MPKYPSTAVTTNAPTNALLSLCRLVILPCEIEISPAEERCQPPCMAVWDEAGFEIASRVSREPPGKGRSKGWLT